MGRASVTAVNQFRDDIQLSKMFGIRGISTSSVAAIVLGLAFCAVGGIKADAGGGRPLQNLGTPSACGPLQSGTPPYRDCMANYASAKTAIIAADTQPKAEPNSSSKAVGIPNRGAQVALIERTANGFWCHITSGGFDGYVPFELVDFGDDAWDPPPGRPPAPHFLYVS